MFIQYNLELRKHSGVQSTLAHLRNRFWIIRARQRIKKVIKQCVKCQRAQSRPFDEKSANMPLDRTTKARPFEVIGIDYFDPMYVLDEIVIIKKDKDRKETETTRV